MASEAKVRRGFKLDRCPMCGADSDDTVITVDLSDVAQFRCTANECEFTADDVRKLMAQWQAVLAWVESAPVMPE